MNTTETQAVHGGMSESYPTELAGRSTAEAVGAIAAVVLAVIGLAGLLSTLLASIATIVIGAGILVEGWSVGATYRRGSTASISASSASGTLTAEFLGGVAGIVLGILAMFQPDKSALLAVAVLVFGATLLLSSFAASQAFWRTGPFYQGSTAASEASEWAVVHSGHLLVGLSALVLGILAVIGLAPMTLVLVGLLGLASAMLLSQIRIA
jgi:hypothetical protein